MVERNNAELQQAQRDYDRNKQLFDRQVLTQRVHGAVYRLAVANANLKSAQVSLERRSATCRTRASTRRSTAS
jgi:multidrug resistance efflux pump